MLVGNKGSKLGGDMWRFYRACIPLFLKTTQKVNCAFAFCCWGGGVALRFRV